MNALRIFRGGWCLVLPADEEARAKEVFAFPGGWERLLASDIKVMVFYEPSPKKRPKEEKPFVKGDDDKMGRLIANGELTFTGFLESYWLGLMSHYDSYTISN